jgi:hypothetical protein
MSRAGLEAARDIVRERKRSMREAVATARGGGEEAGAGLGIVLGVAEPSAIYEGSKLSKEERTEIALDLQYVLGIFISANATH